MTIAAIKKQIVPILRRRGVARAALFGSCARGEMKKGSDIDILIKYDRRSRKSLLDMVKLQFDLEEKLNKKVDLVSYDGISHLLKDLILRDEKIIYEKRS